LYAAGYQQGQVNAIANFCLITQDSNLKVSDADPQVYMPQIESRVPGALASQWVPMDASLWSIPRYEDFLTERRVLLAKAANEFLDGLRAGHLDPSTVLPEEMPDRAADVDEALDPTDRTRDIDDLVAWLVEAGYAEPERDVEIAHPDTGRVLAIAEAVWPNGLQEGLGEKIVLEMDENESDEDALAALGYRMFTSTQSIREFVQRLTANDRLGEA